jgi:isoleucyl-tRNA synthetase
MMPAVEKALIEKGPVGGLAAVRTALDPKDGEGEPSPTERPKGEGGSFTVELDDESLKEFIEIVKEIDKAVRKARGKAGLEYHWPVPRIAIRAKTPNVAAAAENFQTMILSHANARKIDVLQAGEIWHGVNLKMTINEDALEGSYRTWARKIQLILMSQDPWKIKAGIDKGGYEMGIEGQLVKIDGDMVTFQAVVPPYVVVQDFGAGVIFMDTRLTEEEEAEGFANEIVNIVMEARKDLELEDSDPVVIQLVAPDRLRMLLGKQKKYLMEEANAKDLRFVSDVGEEGYIADVEISEESFTIGILPSGESS